jgi:membrane associated rhomboid family serine protease
MIIVSDDADCSCIPVVNNFLILTNVAVFAWMLTNDCFSSSFVLEHGFVPARFLVHHNLLQFSTIIAAMFMHSGFVHIIGNMWVLWLFGDNVEDRLGHLNYLCFYIACGILASCVYMITASQSVLPCVGASGAIAGVMAAYILLFPGATCKTWFGDDSFLLGFRTFQIPARFVIGGWFLFQVVATTVQFEEFANVAVYAHIGGFFAGLCLVSFLRPRDEWKSESESDSSTGRSEILSISSRRGIYPVGNIEYNVPNLIAVCAAFVLILAVTSGMFFTHNSAEASKPPLTAQGSEPIKSKPAKATKVIHHAPRHHGANHRHQSVPDQQRH